MRHAGALLSICLACGDDGALSRDPNPNLTVEPISIDAGVPPAAAKTKRRVGIGDHRRREDSDLRELRRRKPAPAPSAFTEDDSSQRTREQQRTDAEHQRLTNVPLETLTNPSGQTSPIPMR